MVRKEAIRGGELQRTEGKKETNRSKMNPQAILALIGIIVVLLSLWKEFRPDIRLRIISFYYTLDEDKRLLCVLKLQTISNVDLMLEDVNVNLTQEGGKTLDMIPRPVRWKGVIFKMLDLKRRECDYRLKKPLEPDLGICGVKQGANECYISLRSDGPYEGAPIRSWSFRLKYRHYLLPIPNLGIDRRTITVIQPKDPYFDDSLFEKISPEERQKQIDEL